MTTSKSVWSKTGLRTASLDLVERQTIFVEVSDPDKEKELCEYLDAQFPELTYNRNDNWLTVTLLPNRKARS